jgi:hypothetical protein
MGITSNSSDILSQISMVTANFEERPVLENILNDWFQFLGGKPGEVVLIDCGSSPETQMLCWTLFQNKVIDKLQVIRPDHDDFGKDKGFIKEYTAAAIASKPYILCFKTDTLPFRQGHETWLEEAIQYLDREDVFAISGAFSLPSKHHDAWDGWYFSQKCSYNFALMKRSAFMAALHEFAGEFITAGFQGENPAAKTGQDRFLLEVAWEQYIQAHNQFTLCKVEDMNWSVFHVNAHDENLQKIREKYITRQNVQPFLNRGMAEKIVDPHAPRYYGHPSISLWKRIRIWFGTLPFWQFIKRAIAS